MSIENKCNTSGSPCNIHNGKKQFVTCQWGTEIPVILTLLKLYLK